MQVTFVKKVFKLDTFSTSQPGLDTCSIISMKAGGEEDSLSGAFEKEMSQWTNVVGGGPPTKSKGPLRRGGTFSAPSFIVISSVSMTGTWLHKQLG